MAKRKNDTLKRPSDKRSYRDVCWVSAEGQTEKDYFSMNAFKGASMAIKFPKNIHPDRRSPSQVLKRFKKVMRTESFRAGDEAWIVVDVDTWGSSEFAELLSWAGEDLRHHLAISNPKFELFLVLHFERGNGCTTPQKVDDALKRYLPRYAKRISATQFTLNDVGAAVENAKTKRAGCKGIVPAPGMTDVHLLVERLIGKR